MKSWIKQILLLVGYSIPFPFLALYGDVTYGTMLFYGIMIVGLFLLCKVSIKFGYAKIVILGNILSYIFSYFLMLKVQTEMWSWYFKPFSSKGLLSIVSFMAFVIQMAFLYYSRVKQGNREKQ